MDPHFKAIKEAFVAFRKEYILEDKALFDDRCETLLRTIETSRNEGSLVPLCNLLNIAAGMVDEALVAEESYHWRASKCGYAYQIVSNAFRLVEETNN